MPKSVDQLVLKKDYEDFQCHKKYAMRLVPLNVSIHGINIKEI